jgi:uncharacterized protein
MNGPTKVAPTDTLDDALRAKYAALRARLEALSPVVVALSGGVDSSLLLAVAADALGARAHAAIGVSPSVDASEIDEARALAASLGVTLREVETAELDDPRYVVNAGDRCFFCKTELYSKLLAATEDIPLRTVVDGNHAGDVGADRPGMRANATLGIASPLQDVGLGKAEIRALSRALGLAQWDKPEAACLASRVPVGTAVTAGTLGRIGAAERVLKSLGFRHVRVRHEGHIARVEVSPSDMPRVVDERTAIVAGIRSVGYDYVTLDLGGYTKGGRGTHDG